MKTAMKLNRMEDDNQNAPKAKTLDLQLSILHADLGMEVKKAFNLAKSSGQELNLSFSHGPCLQLQNPWKLR
jgi:hypothetical protein